MTVTRLFSDQHGDSHFEDRDISLFESGQIGRLSDAVPARSMILRETGPDYDYDFHNAPARQFIIMLDGCVEIETSLGVTRRFAGGDVLFAEDTTGRGHRSRSVDNLPRRSIFVTVPDDFAL